MSNGKDKLSARSMSRIIFGQFLEHRFATIGALIIVFFVLLALLAPVISWVMDITPFEQNVTSRYRPPMSRVAYGDGKRERALESYCVQEKERVAAIISTIETTLGDVHQELDEGSECDYLMGLSALLDDEEEVEQDLQKLSNADINHFLQYRQGFFTTHIFGTDELGRDVFMRLIYGTRVSVGIGILVSISAALLGLLIGSLAGFYGGVVDSVCMRVTDSLLSLPLLPVMIVVAAIDIGKIPIVVELVGDASIGIFKLVFVLCIFSWMTIARLVRGSILSLKEREFIYAAKTLGSRDFSIIIRHIIPNVMAPLLVAVTLNIGQSILSEAALSFLGLGIQPPMPSWGNMLFNAQEVVYESPSLALLPGALILIVVISFNFIGDGLQDAVDPTSIKR